MNINEFCGKKNVSRADGAVVYDKISKKWKNQNIEIDFDNVLIASVSFIDEVFGQLALNYPLTEIQAKVKLSNVQDFDRALISDVLQSRSRQREHHTNQST